MVVIWCKSALHGYLDPARRRIVRVRDRRLGGLFKHHPVGREAELFERRLHALRAVLRQLGVDGRITDRKSVVLGKSVSVRVDLGGRRSIKKKNNKRERKSRV